MTSQQTESDIKREISDYLAGFPSRCLFTVHLAGRRGYQSKHLVKGWPDISGIWDAKPLFIEVKKPGGTLRLEQHEILKRAEKMGAIAIVATSVDDVALALSAAQACPA